MIDSLVVKAPSFVMMCNNLIPYYSLTERIRSLSNQSISAKLSHEEMSDLQKAVKLSRSWMWPSSRMKELLSNVPSTTIESFLLQIMQKGTSSEVDYYFSCLNSLAKHALLELSLFKTSDAAAQRFKLNGLLKNTALASGLKKEGKIILKEFLIELKQFIHHVLDIIIGLTGINELSRSKHSRYGEEGKIGFYEAQHKIRGYLALLTYPTTVFGVYYSYLKMTAPSLLLTSVTVVSSLVFLIAYNRYGKPCPVECDGLKNLTIEVLNHREPIYPRFGLLNRIKEAFKQKKGVILVGAQGCGKTMLVKSLIDQALKGHFLDISKSLQIHSCNATRFTAMGIDSISYSAIEDRFKSYNEEVGFFIDEFHALFKSEGIQVHQAGEEIKTFHDTFRFIIGGTTYKDFNDYIKDKTAIVNRRFVVIDLGTPSDEELVEMINYRLGGMNLPIVYDPEVSKYIVEKMKEQKSETSILDTTHTFLNRVLGKVSAVRHEQREQQVTFLKSDLAILEHQSINGIQRISDQERSCQINRKKEALNNANDELQKLNQRTEKMLAMEKVLVSLKRQAYAISDSETNLVEGSSEECEWLKLHARITLAAKFIAEERKQLGLPHVLDKALVDSVLAQN